MANAPEGALLVKEMASRPESQRIPIYSVSVGDPSEPKDIELSVEGPQIVLPEDPSTLVA